MSGLYRLAKLQKKINGTGCDAVLIEDSTSLFYLTGLQFSAGSLLVTPQESHLIVDGRYFEIASKGLEVPVHLLDERILQKLLKQLKVQTLGFAKESTTYARYAGLQQKITSKIVLEPIENPVVALRMIKDANEIKRLKEAAELGSKGYEFILSLLRPGVTEKQLATELELFWRAEGAKGPGFEPIIGFGANASMPHYRSGDTQLKKGDIVLIDIGVILADYHSDMTRCVFYGKPKPKLKEVYELVREAQARALSMCKPGVTAGALDEAARSYLKKAGYEKEFSHSLGHGLGMEIHEDPRLSNNPLYANVKLKKGMVITIEPGIYLPGIGGVRIEDTVLVTANGYENLSRPTKELTVFHGGH